jgi:hypothetical protein
MPFLNSPRDVSIEHSVLIDVAGNVMCHPHDSGERI